MDHLPLLESRGVQGLFGWKCVVDPTSMGRFLRRAGHAGAKVVEEALRKAVRPRWEATGGVPRVVQLTLDSAVSVRYGVKQAGAEVGYNPTKKGRPSHHPLLAFLDTGDCLGVRWRPGDANPATGAEEWIEGLVKWLRRIRTPGKLVRHARRLQLKLAHGDPVTQWLRDGLARLRTLQAQPITAM